MPLALAVLSAADPVGSDAWAGFRRDGTSRTATCR